LPNPGFATKIARREDLAIGSPLPPSLERVAVGGESAVRFRLCLPGACDTIMKVLGFGWGSDWDGGREQSKTLERIKKKTNWKETNGGKNESGAPTIAERQKIRSFPNPL